MTVYVNMQKNKLKVEYGTVPVSKVKFQCM